MSGKSVYSVTGAEVNLKEASLESLAEAADGMDEEISRLYEARSLVDREIARRVSDSEDAGDWRIVVRPRVHVSKRTER